MNKEEIMAMSPEQLIIEIAKLKGYFERSIITFDDILPSQRYGLPRWTTSIAEAWKLVEEVIAQEFWVDIENYPSTISLWSVSFGTSNFLGTSAPLAICRAWLMWKTGESK